MPYETKGVPTPTKGALSMNSRTSTSVLVLCVVLVGCSAGLLARYSGHHSLPLTEDDEQLVDINVFVKDKPSASPKSVFSLTDRGQAALIEALGEKSKSSSALAEASATPIAAEPSPEYYEDRSSFAKRLVLSTERTQVSVGDPAYARLRDEPADRITSMRCTFAGLTPKDSRFKSWDAATTKYATIELGKATLEQSIDATFTAKAGTDGATPSGSAEVKAGRKLTEEANFRRRYLELNVEIDSSRDQLIVVQEGAAGIDLKGNALIDLDVEVKTMPKDKATRVLSIAPMKDENGRWQAAHQMHASERKISFPRAAAAVRGSVRCQYVVRKAYRKGNTVSEGDDHAVFMEGTLSKPEGSVVFVERKDMKGTVWVVRESPKTKGKSGNAPSEKELNVKRQRPLEMRLFDKWEKADAFLKAIKNNDNQSGLCQEATDPRDDAHDALYLGPMRPGGAPGKPTSANAFRRLQTTQTEDLEVIPLPTGHVLRNRITRELVYQSKLEAFEEVSPRDKEGAEKELKRGAECAPVATGDYVYFVDGIPWATDLAKDPTAPASGPNGDKKTWRKRKKGPKALLSGTADAMKKQLSELTKREESSGAERCAQVVDKKHAFFMGENPLKIEHIKDLEVIKPKGWAVATKTKPRSSSRAFVFRRQQEGEDRVRFASHDEASSFVSWLREGKHLHPEEVRVSNAVFYLGDCVLRNEQISRLDIGEHTVNELKEKPSVTVSDGFTSTDASDASGDTASISMNSRGEGKLKVSIANPRGTRLHLTIKITDGNFCNVANEENKNEEDKSEENKSEVELSVDPHEEEHTYRLCGLKKDKLVGISAWAKYEDDSGEECAIDVDWGIEPPSKEEDLPKHGEEGGQECPSNVHGAKVAVKPINKEEELKMALDDLIDSLRGLGSSDFGSVDARKEFIGDVERLKRRVDRKHFTTIRKTLRFDVERRSNGCESNERPDGNDLIVKCAAQRRVQPYVKRAIDATELSEPPASSGGG